MLSIDDLEVLHGLFKEPIIDIKFKMADGRRFNNSFFGHYLAAHCLISVKFCAGKQFIAEFRQWDRYMRSTKRISLF